MLELASWLGAAKRLAPGRESRVPHHCGSGAVMKVSFDGDRYSAYCFRCGDSGSHRIEVPLARRLELLREQAQADADLFGDTLPPTPALPWREWPEVARLWLLKAGLSAADVPGLGAYYSPPSQRVVLRVLVGSGRGYWIARALKWRPGDPRPKYLARPGGAANVVPRYGSASRIVLTEDLLSAYKIGTVGEAWCLLGTSARHKLLGELLADGRPVSIWLDPDPAGVAAASKVAAQLRAYGVDTTIIKSERDPKLHHREEISKILISFENFKEQP